MLTLLGSLLGFVSSAFPDLLKLWQDHQDRRHELAILDRQMEQMRLGHSQRLEEIAVEADIAESQALYKHDSQPSGVGWVDGLRASVRPVITYAFFLLFTTVKASALYVMVSAEGLTVIQALPQIWDPETQALFAAVMSFWFGQRALAKARGGVRCATSPGRGWISSSSSKDSRRASISARPVIRPSAMAMWFGTWKKNDSLTGLTGMKAKSFSGRTCVGQNEVYFG